MSAYFVWAGSKTGTKSRPIRRLICEEPDEYPAFSSGGGDPFSKAEKRLTTYRDKGQAKILIGGTPTNRMGNAFKRWDLCSDKRHFWVPCPHCSGYQLLLWKQVKYPPPAEGEDRRKHAERLRTVGLAYYECEHCKGRIDDHHKPAMLRQGKWASEDQVVTRDGRIVGPKSNAKRVGFKISGLYSPWVLFGQLASEWVEAQNDPDALADFINQRLAEPFEEQRAKIEPTLIELKAKGGSKPLIVPNWARLLLATADTQGDDESTGYFWYVIRAWGYDYRSQLVDYGVCHSKGELTERCLVRPLPMEGRYNVVPTMLAIDSGGKRWSEVYQLAQADSRIKPIKGASKKQVGMLEEKPQKKHPGVTLLFVDTNQSKDLLHRLIHDPDMTKWLPHSEVSPDYCKQMCSESKIYDPRTKQEHWVEIVRNNNHLWDCEQYQCAVAWRMGAGSPEPPPEPAKSDKREERESYLTDRSNWGKK